MSGGKGPSSLEACDAPPVLVTHSTSHPLEVDFQKAQLNIIGVYFKFTAMDAVFELPDLLRNSLNFLQGK